MELKYGIKEHRPAESGLPIAPNGIEIVMLLLLWKTQPLPIAPNGIEIK